jgi:hypothetical protein
MIQLPQKGKGMRPLPSPMIGDYLMPAFAGHDR